VVLTGQPGHLLRRIGTEQGLEPGRVSNLLSQPLRQAAGPRVSLAFDRGILGTAIERSVNLIPHRRHHPSSGVAPRALIRYLHPQVRSRRASDRSRRLVVRRRLLSATSQTGRRASDRRLAARAVLPVAHGKPQRVSSSLPTTYPGVPTQARTRFFMNHVASSSISMRTGKTFGALIERVRFAADSALEEDGFELLVASQDELRSSHHPLGCLRWIGAPEPTPRFSRAGGGAWAWAWAELWAPHVSPGRAGLRRRPCTPRRPGHR
jgi:hypothetical protein